MHLGVASMLFRSCAGGVVFHGNSLFLLLNEKNEWVLPKGLIRNGMLAKEVAVSRVKFEAGIDAEVLCPAGHTSYEFYSFTRQKPVCNEITWYIMRARSGGYQVNKAEGFKDGGYFSMEEANGLITYSQDKSLVRMAYEKYRNL